MGRSMDETRGWMYHGEVRTLDMIEKSSVAKKEDFTSAQDQLHFVLFLRIPTRDTSD